MGASNSLSNKIMMATGLSVCVVLVGFLGVTGWRTAERVKAEVTALATEKAAGIAAQVGGEITEAVSAGTAMAAGLSVTLPPVCPRS